MGKPLRQQNETNNYFLLQCMAGITVAALTAAAITALAVLQFGATASGLATTNMMFASSLAAASSPILPMVVIGAIGFALLLSLFNNCGSNNTTVRVVPTRPYGSFWGGSSYGWGSSPNVHVHHTGHHHDGQVHNHGGHIHVPSSSTHSHPSSSSGNIHSHFPSGNVHSHGGGARVEVHGNHGTTHGHRM
ncbi:hypothetical protein [Legionella rowbothamii]|uniref:hypothetical protein n=1 Tax=Legionella rowbothamii TaxID=96229 RepID=UPI001054646F|nr:hypothetical protein [Legionella rowbothamii]